MMSRIHGRRGQLYVGIASQGAVASPVPFLGKWTITFANDDVDVTAFGDVNKVYVSGLPDVGGTYDGFIDTTTAQLYTAASDGLDRAFYLYMDNSITTSYWYGRATFDFNATGGVSEAVAINGAWKAAGAITRVG
jgi:hypothetical protein